MTDAVPVIRHIDPFDEPYITMAAKKPRQEYLDLYRRLFDEFPKKFRELVRKQLDEYDDRVIALLSDPWVLVDWGRAVAHATDMTSLWLELSRGMLNQWHDERAKMELREPSEDFKLGENVGNTPKETVYSSELLDVYRYLPDGPVHRIPFLMFYSWINAYWILDLTEETSLMRHLRDQGVETFITAWKIPESQSGRTAPLDTYLREGMAAIDRVLEVTGQKGLGIGGYCIGGVVADILAALRSPQTRCLVNLATALDTMAGEQGAGAFGAFTNFEIGNLQEFLNRHGGGFPKKAFEEFFDNVKPKRAVRSFFSRYVYGDTTPMDPITFWNRKSAKPIMPVHAEFLRRIYNDNELAEGTMSVMGQKVDLKRLTAPALIVMAEFDHIVPLPCALRTAHLIGTKPQDMDNVVVRGGHVRAITNRSLNPVISQFLAGTLGPKDRRSPHRLGLENPDSDSDI